MQCPYRSSFLIPLLLFLFGASLPSSAAVPGGGTEIAAIRIAGASQIAESRLLSALPVQRHSPYSSAALQASARVLAILYRGEGFLFVSIDSMRTEYTVDSLQATITIYLTEGERFVLGRLSISGAAHWPEDELLRWCTTKTDEPLSQATVENDIEFLLQQYENAGYPFVSISVDTLRPESSHPRTLELILKIDEGARVFLTEVRVEGNTVTRSDVIIREARVSALGLYRQTQLERLRRRLDRLTIFASVELPQLYLTTPVSRPDSTPAGLLVRVHEGPTSTFDGIAGYVPPATSTGQGYFMGNVTVVMRNLFGTGRRLSARWLRENEWTQELEAGYMEPWIAGYPVNGGIAYFQRKQDSSYVKSRIDVRIDVSPADDLSIGAVLQREDVYPSSASAMFTAYESNMTSVGLDVRYDTRDNVRNPRRGVAYGAFYQRGTKNITGPAQYLTSGMDRNATVEKITMDVEAAFPLSLNHVIVAAVHGKQITSPRLEPSDLFQIGGANSLRGYRENQFLGSHVAWTNLEYRFLTGRLSSVFLLFDEGYILHPADERLQTARQELFRAGYGFGARVETGLGIIRVSYALGEGDTFTTGKIHFGIANDF
jgi:outer membrane protein insertion porin family